MSFDFNNLSANAGSDGIVGPFINWQAKTGQHAQGQTWTIRIRMDDNSSRVDDITENFKEGVVLDYESIKLGWEKWAPMGQRNERSWAPTPNLETFPRPSNDKRMNEMGREVFFWQKVFAVRTAVRQNLAGSWFQSSSGAMTAFEAFIEQLKASGPQHPGKLPKVRFEGVVEGYGGALVPQLRIVNWLDRPACLTQELPGVAAMSTGAPVAQAQPALQQSEPAPGQQTQASAGGF